MSRFQSAVSLELRKARKRHPGKQPSLHHGYAVLLEEVRELEKEVFSKTPNNGALLEELTQIAAVAQRMAEDLILPNCTHQVSFKEWMKMLKLVMVRDYGYKKSVVNQEDEEAWKKYYDAGYTVDAAIQEDLSYESYA